MPRIVCIVEGQGDVAAVPVLLRRIASELAPDLPLNIPTPIRRPVTKLMKAGELEKDIDLAIATAGADGAVLVLLDSEDSPVCVFGPQLQLRINKHRPGERTFVTLANREFETWFIAAAESLAGRRKLPPDLECPPHFEAKRDAKGWLSDHMRDSAIYKETADQAALAQLFDMNLAKQRSHSFARLWRVCEEMFLAIKNHS
jgi:hypothetical protein